MATIRSMTGFGEAEGRIANATLRVQLKSVNHRFLNVSVRTPAGFDRVEAELQSWLRERVTRGHVTVAVTLEADAESEAQRLPVADLARARHYHEQIVRLKGELGLSGEVELSSLLRFSDVFRPADGPAFDADEAVAALRSVFDAAVDSLVSMREAEGRRLADDLEGRLAAIERELVRIGARAPQRLATERERLHAQIAELVGDEQVDEDRLAREVAWLAEKWDVNEEIVRFGSHVELFREALAAEPGTAVGKKLSFIVQEMNREANTIGSKANDAEIAHASVALKEEIERLREQVENVE